MQIMYVGPFDAVDIVVGHDDFNEPVWLTVERSKPFDVDPQIAGRPPARDYLAAHDVIGKLHPMTIDPHLVDDERKAVHAALAEAHAVRRESDPGEGLLAQVDNWSPVATQPPPPPPNLSKKDKEAMAALSDGEQAALAELSADDVAALSALSDDERQALKEGGPQ